MKFFHLLKKSTKKKRHFENMRMLLVWNGLEVWSFLFFPFLFFGGKSGNMTFTTVGRSISLQIGLDITAQNLTKVYRDQRCPSGHNFRVKWLVGTL